MRLLNIVMVVFRLVLKMRNGGGGCFKSDGKKRSVSKAVRLRKAKQLSLLTLCTPLKMGVYTKKEKR